MDAQREAKRLETLRFGEFLVERAVLDEGQLLDVLAEHWATGDRIGRAVSRRGYLTPDEVETFAAEYHNLDVVEIPAESPGN